MDQLINEELESELTDEEDVEGGESDGGNQNG